MSRTFKAVMLFIGASLACGVSESGAQEVPFLNIPPYILDQMKREGTLDHYLKRFTDEFERADIDGNGLSMDDFTIVDDIQMARSRASRVEQLIQLDLDANGEVTRDEARRAISYFVRDRFENNAKREIEISSQVDGFMAMDQDGNQIVTLTEAMAIMPRDSKAHNPIGHEASMLDLDPNKDGWLTLEELEGIVGRSFNEADYDHNGTLSAAELALLGEAREAHRLVKEAGPCGLPMPKAGSLVGILGIYGGVRQPNVTVAGQNGTTELVMIEIEPGTEPLFVVLGSFAPVIWKFEGAVDRVEHAAVVRSRAYGNHPQMAGAGTIGLASEKVTFMEPQSCGFNMIWKDGLKKQIASGIAQKAIGRRPDVVHSLYNAKTITLPSGKASGGSSDRRLIYIGDRGNITVAPNQGPNVKIVHGSDPASLIAMEDWIADASNLMDVDPLSVLAPGSVERYDILPHNYGLRQLVQLGYLERTKDRYRIIKPFPRFPAQLTGGHSVTFILPEGMPMPAGDPGHSEIILEPAKP